MSGPSVTTPTPGPPDCERDCVGLLSVAVGVREEVLEAVEEVRHKVQEEVVEEERHKVRKKAARTRSERSGRRCKLCRKLWATGRGGTTAQGARRWKRQWRCKSTNKVLRFQ